MTAFLMKMIGLAVFLGFLSVILPDGRMKGFARAGIGLLFSAAVLFPAVDFIRSAGGEDSAEYMEGKLRGLFAAAEMKEQTEEGLTGAVLEKYRARLSEEAADFVFRETGVRTEPVFVVCGDAASERFGRIEFIHCRVIGTGAEAGPEGGSAGGSESGSAGGEDSSSDGGSRRPFDPIRKIEITLHGLYIDGIRLFGKEETVNDGAEDSLAQEAERSRIRKAVTDALRRFCGVEAEMCSVFWPS